MSENRNNVPRDWKNDPETIDRNLDAARIVDFIINESALTDGQKMALIDCYNLDESVPLTGNLRSSKVVKEAAIKRLKNMGLVTSMIEDFFS